MSALKCSAQRKRISKTGVKIYKQEFWNNLCQHFESRCYCNFTITPQTWSNQMQCDTVSWTVSHSSLSESSPAPICEPQTLHYTPLWGEYSITCLAIKKSTNHERAPFHSSCDVGTTALLLASYNPTISHWHYHVQTDLSLRVKRLLVHKLPVRLRALKSHKQLFVHVQGAQCKLKDCIQCAMLSF